jgi:two-component system, OmpR family, copper resistance phosphate regulon response regulator CusR
MEENHAVGTGKKHPLRILVVEDEVKVAKALREGLEAEQHQVALAHTGEEAFFLATSQVFDLMVLDLGLPGRSGLEILQVLRRQGFQTTVLILTAKDSVEDRVAGLDAGADDYLVKPFAFPELLARIRALTRRGRSEPCTKLRLADLLLDCISRKVARMDRDIELTAKEFDVLEYLLRHQGETVSRDMLAREIWQVAARATPMDNVIDVHIARLRKKIDDPFENKLLRTIRGVGFQLSETRL